MSKAKTGGQSLIKGATIISLGGLISKVLGAIYRIPLLNFLGSSGMGIYQMVYPLYCMLLTLSSSCLPSGIARMISCGQYNGVEKKAFKVYGIIGGICCLLMFAMSDLLAYIEGERVVSLACKILAPCVFTSAILSVVRGYFQGLDNMLPTAISEVIEQIVKVALGTILLYFARGNQNVDVCLAILAVSFGQVFATAYSLIIYFRHKATLSRAYVPLNIKAKSIFAITLPLTLIAAIMPLSQLSECILIVKMLKAKGLNGASLYGIFSGCAVTMINLPVSLTYGLAAAGIPAITKLVAKGDRDGAERSILKVLTVTLFISAVCAALLYAFCPMVGGIIFSSLKGENFVLFIKLVRIMSINAITLSLVQSSSACLTAMGKPMYGAIAQIVSCTLRIMLTIVLINFCNMGIVGGAISANCSYLVAVLLNFWYIIKEKNNWSTTYADNFDRIGNKKRRVDGGRL